MEKFYFACCLINVTISVVCGTIRYFQLYRFEKNNRDIQPGIKIIATTYFLSLLQLPYLMSPSDNDVWIYILAAGIILYPLLFIIPLKSLFNFEDKRFFRIHNIILLFALLQIILLISLLINGTLLSKYSKFILGITSIIGIIVTIVICVIVKRLKNQMGDLNFRDIYSNEGFHYHIVYKAIAVPLLWAIMIWIIMLTESQLIKAISDLVFSLIMIAFLINILSVDIPVVKQNDNNFNNNTIDSNEAKLSMSESDLKILRKIFIILTEEKLYQNPSLKRDDLAKAVNCNHTYLTRIIRQEYGSFYNLINGFRLIHARKLISSHKYLKFDIIAKESGFTSRQTFSRAKSKISEAEIDKIMTHLTNFSSRE